MFKKINQAALVLLIIFATTAGAGVREILLSTAVPGLGQMYSGNTKDKIVGLSFLGAEVVALHMFFNNVSLYNSLCQETENLQKQMPVETNSSYSDLMVARAQWKKTYDDAQNTKDMIMPLLGAAIGIWVLNVAEVVVFPPAGKEAPAAPAPAEEKTSLRNSLDYQLVYKNAQPQLLLTYTF